MVERIPTFGLGHLPRVTFGAGVFGRVPQIVATHGSRVLLVTGGRSFNQSPRRAELESGVAELGVTLVGSTIVSGEPGPSDVQEPLARFRGEDVDVILGVGGGAVLDTAKAIAGLLRTDTELMDHLEGVGPRAALSRTGRARGGRAHDGRHRLGGRRATQSSPSAARRATSAASGTSRWCLPTR